MKRCRQVSQTWSRTVCGIVNSYLNYKAIEQNCVPVLFLQMFVPALFVSMRNGSMTNFTRPGYDHVLKALSTPQHTRDQTQAVSGISIEVNHKCSLGTSRVEYIDNTHKSNVDELDPFGHKKDIKMIAKLSSFLAYSVDYSIKRLILCFTLHSRHIKLTSTFHPTSDSLFIVLS